MDLGDWVSVGLLASLSLVSTAGGVWLAVRVGRRPRAVPLGIGFSVGTMVAVSVLELLPEAHDERGFVPVALASLAGAGMLAALHLVIPHTHLVAEGATGSAVEVRTAYLVAIGLILHDLPEGFALANSYVTSPELGVVVALAIALHNLPEEFAMALPVLTLGQRRLLVRAATGSALAEPAGALVGLVAVGISPGLNALFLAFAAGAMLYVSIHELTPMARRHGHLGAFAVGASVAVATVATLGLVVGT